MFREHELRELPITVIKNAITKYGTYAEILKHLGLSAKPYSNITVLKKILKTHNLTIPVLNHGGKGKSKPRRVKPKDYGKYFCANSKVSRNQIIRILKNHKLLPYDKCAICNQSDNWNSKPLVLQLDHKNGINNDHRLENLQFICPNCHTQLPTYAGKNIRRSATERQGQSLQKTNM